jgi:hypothetical protein
MQRFIMPPPPGKQVLFVEPDPGEDLILILKAIAKAGMNAVPAFYYSSMQDAVFVLFINAADVKDPAAPPLGDDWEKLAEIFEASNLDPGMVRSPWRASTQVKEVIAA